MRTFRQLISGATIFLVFLLTTAGCESKKHTSLKNPSQARSTLDTAKIQAALRKFDAQDPGVADSIKSKQLKKILQQSIAMGYNDQACTLLMDIARAHASRGDFDSTFHYFNQARTYCNNPNFDKTLPAAFLADLGAFYSSLRSEEIAANKSYYQALNYLKAKNLTENTLTIKLYLYLFYTQEKLGNPERGLSYLKEAEKLALKLNYIPALISVRTNLGNYYAERKDFKAAQKYFGLAVADAEKNWQPDWHPNILMAALVGKASAFTKTGEAEKAIPLLKKALQIARENQIIYSEVVAAIELGGAYNKLNRYRETLELVTTALKAQGGDFNWYKEEGYKVLMDAYEGLGQYKPALEYQRKLYAFNDSLTNKDKTVALNELEIKFQTAIKDKDIAAKKLLIETQKNKISRNNTLIAGISGAAVLAVLLLVILYKNAAQKQNIQQLEIQTLRRQQEIEILRSKMQGEEQERKRLSRELHDGIGSMIASVIMRLSLLKKQDPALVTSKDFEEVLQMLQETGQEVRKTSHNIMTDIIDKQSLFEAIKGYCDSISRGSQVKIDVQFYGDSDKFSSHCKHVIYRIVQELVHNIIKHAQATEAIVQGVVSEDSFNLTVEDNGIGFDATSGPKGLGLRNVESRVKSLFGEFHVESSPGKGTTFNMEFECEKLHQEIPQVV